MDLKKIKIVLLVLKLKIRIINIAIYFYFIFNAFIYNIINRSKIISYLQILYRRNKKIICLKVKKSVIIFGL